MKLSKKLKMRKKDYEYSKGEIYMSLVNPLPFIKSAQKEGRAIAAFNIHNMETIQAVVEGAAAEKTPVIIQTTPGTLRHAGIEFIVANIRTAAKLYDIPIALHLDHCNSFKTIVKAIQNGYTSVMVDGSALPYAENVALVKEVVKVARAADVNVEAELGRIGGTEDELTVDERKATLTIPKEALEFVQATQIDFLAVAIGTAHGVYKGEPELDFDRLAAIRQMIDLPLVLHGASGVPDESIKKAIANGISKINIATELKIPLAKAVRSYFSINPTGNDPRKYLGSGKKAVKKTVRKKIQLCSLNE